MTLCPSRLFGGPDHLFVPNIVLPHGEDPSSPSAPWRPIDGTINNADLGELYTHPHVARTLYVTRDIRPARILTLAWDTPAAMYVSGGVFPPGWHECRVVTEEMIARMWEAGAQLEVGGVIEDEWKRAEMLERVRGVLRIVEEMR